MYTPAVIINYEIMMRNLREIQELCNERGVKLRPHFKAHKTPYLADIQRQLGAIGFTTAKLAEAELLVEEGFKDILIAYPIVSEENVKRLKEISGKVKISTIIDSLEGAKILSQGFANQTLDVLIKIDTGLNRCGLKPSSEDIFNFVKEVLKLKNLNLKGLLTHGGHSYKAKSIEEIKLIAETEGKTLLNLKEFLEMKGIMIDEISVGSTPTLRHLLEIPQITEVRPGNYIFNDYTQVSLNTTTINNCALKVRSTVISRGNGKFIIDAGSKTLGLDKGTHGNEIIKGYGKILEYPEAEIVALSEEHGIVKSPMLPKIGEKITIIPNHSCVVMNLAPFVYLEKEGKYILLENKGSRLNF
ncbi:alanine racemase [Anaerobranca gottschalkii]|uniref:D-serine deaminase, pyridoxal phosphate-dependent n=1 Tax=Anaerobranca gottschalkii DSM 13577 TaxID=1120990 RepID=A0A1I0B2J5_9FIRM|nr:alanine racemase [Anaerobranca gottschalkii]SET01074.1 D-serine deaminase, pyridoxal phosphate-dependent [Anaerobranca gottschalkii DSM 13577]